MGVKPRAIEVHIQELVLEGVSPADRFRVGAALERELARLLGQGALPAGLTQAGGRDAVDAGTFTRPAGATPATLGASVARSVYRGFKR